jgi:hypothetical protein
MISNKILKFIELVTENHQEDELELQDVLLDLQDELIDYQLHKGYFSKKALELGQYGDSVSGFLHNKPIYEDDKYCFCIEIAASQLKNDIGTLNRSRFGNRLLITDNKIFTIFRELSLISQRYGNYYLHINIGSTTYNPAIYLFILLDTEIDTDATKIMQIYKEIKSRNSAAKSEFSNDTTVKLENDEIIIKTSRGYTDRKFKNLIRGIDLSDYDIVKSEEVGSTVPVTINKIKKKK